MKKFICGLMVFSMLSLAAPKKEAHAGFIIVAMVEESVYNHKHKFDDYIIYFFAASLITYSFFVLTTGLNSAYSIGAGIVLLDEKIENSQANIKASLAARYPFLDDSASIQNLSSLIVSKYASTKDAEGNAEIKLNAQEVKNSVQSLDLTQDQLNELVASLN